MLILYKVIQQKNLANEPENILPDLALLKPSHSSEQRCQKHQQQDPSLITLKNKKENLWYLYI